MSTNDPPENATKSTISAEGLKSALDGLRSAISELSTGLAKRPGLDEQEREDLGSYVKRLAGRFAVSHFGGACTLCNNLQPDGHENSSTFNRTIFDRWHGDDFIIEQKGQTGTRLYIEKIEFQPLLNKRIYPEDASSGVQTDKVCRYCTLLCDILDAFFPNWKGYFPYEGLERYISLQIKDDSPLILSATNLVTSAEWNHNRVDIELYHVPDERTNGSRANLPQESQSSDLVEATAAKEVDGNNIIEDSKPAKTSLLPTMGPALPKFDASDSLECFRLVTDCFQECIEHHELCSSALADSSPFVPTRLLYIGASDSDLRLWESHQPGSEVSSIPRWAALSHCWGKSTILQLTASTLASMKLAINHADLPATFQDAIRVCRLLKIEHVWIDSLCIIQDSRADWEAQAVHMGTIYEKALLVISAASSPSPTTPFLCKRDDEWNPKSFRFVAEDGTTHEILARRRHVLAADLVQDLKEPPYTSSWATLPRIGPLQRRAWVFQESFLASRNLQFNPGGLVWECKVHRRIEGHLPPYPDLRENTLGTLLTDRKWHMIVKAYTSRKLTFIGDRLPAIAGIAAQMAREKHRDLVQANKSPSENEPTYLAGLWRSSIYVDLLWHTMPGGDHRPLAFGKGVMASPSWSWISVDRGVLWNSGYRNFTPLAEVVNAAVSLRKPAAEGVIPNRFGEVVSGVVGLRGRMLECCVFYNAFTRTHFIHLRRPDGTRTKGVYFRADGLLKPFAILNPAPTAPNATDPNPNDAQGSSDMRKSGPERTWYIRRAWPGEEDHQSPIYKQEAKAWLLFMAKTTPFTSFDHVGLVLGYAGHPKCFFRLGYVENVTEEWYNEATMSEAVVL